MKLSALIVLVLATSTAVLAAPKATKGEGEDVEIELGLVENLRKLLQWMKDNDISISDIFSSELFNSDLFNSEIFNSQYFNHEFFSSELFNSQIFNHENFTKVLYSLYGVTTSGTGVFNRSNAVELIAFFETKDWQGLTNYLNNLPTPPPAL